MMRLRQPVLNQAEAVDSVIKSGEVFVNFYPDKNEIEIRSVDSEFMPIRLALHWEDVFRNKSEDYVLRLFKSEDRYLLTGHHDSTEGREEIFIDLSVMKKSLPAVLPEAGGL